MNKKLIRLTEQDLHRIVKESVKKVLNEIGDTNRGQYMLGRLAGRKWNDGNLSDHLNVSDYAKQRRIEKNGDIGDNDFVIDNPLKYNFVHGNRNYRLHTNPDYEWGDGYEDENGNINYALKNGSVENERGVAKDWLDSI